MPCAELDGTLINAHISIASQVGGTMIALTRNSQRIFCGETLRKKYPSVKGEDIGVATSLQHKRKLDKPVDKIAHGAWRADKLEND
jgi:hypothetical protein